MKSFLVARCGAAIGVAAVLAVCSAKAAVILTYAESAGTQTTSVGGATVFNFKSLPLGLNTSVSCFGGAGTIDKVDVITADQYGGADGNDRYPVESESVGAGNTTTTLHFGTPITYFGLWWSAGDPTNFLKFYSGSTLVASFDTLWLESQIPVPATKPGGYYGNPTKDFSGQDAGEPFAFINFFASAGVTFDNIELIDDAGSGFESDNWTIRAAPYGTVTGDGTTLPGVPVERVTGDTSTHLDPADPLPAAPSGLPEPCLWKLFLFGGLVGVVWQRRAIFCRRAATAAAS